MPARHVPPERSVDELKELKVRIPRNYHIQLQRVKVLRGINFAHQVRDALDAYFVQLESSTVEPLSS